MGWLIALVVWTAAGARAGRVAARERTPLRVAMVIAVTNAALAVTFVIPDVASHLDQLVPGLSEVLIELAWTAFAASSAVGAVSVWPILPRRALRALALSVYTVALILGIALAVGYPVFASVFILVALASVVVTGAWHVAWTPLGRGIALIVAGSIIILVTVVVELVRQAGGTEEYIGGSSVYAVAAVMVSFGAVWVLVETWVRARLDLHRLRRMHSVLVTRFPEVVEGDGKSSTTVLRASDTVAQIMDALYLQSGAGTFAAEGRGLPESTDDRARILARWIDDPTRSDVLDSEWIAPPEKMSPRRWVLYLAQAHAQLRKAGADGESVDLPSEAAL